MVTEKQKCIAEQAVYGDLHFVNPSGNVCKLDVVSSIVAYNDKGAIFTPILRPLSDLTKEITHKGYNEDKPFIPIVKLFEHLQGLYLTDHDKSDFKISLETNSDSGGNDEGYWSVMIFDDLKLEINECGVPAFFSCNMNKSDWKYDFITVSHSYYDILHQLHFDTRELTLTNEAIDVNTLSINPYSVQ